MTTGGASDSGLVVKVQSLNSEQTAKVSHHGDWYHQVRVLSSGVLLRVVFAAATVVAWITLVGCCIAHNLSRRQETAKVSVQYCNFACALLATAGILACKSPTKSTTTDLIPIRVHPLQ